MAKETTSYHFTSNSAGDDLVTDHVKKISQFIELKLGEGLLALVLAGSFGRGEGSICRHDDGRVEPINDYDFLIVLKASAPAMARETLAKWELECSRITGMRWIDFSTLSESRLPRLPLTQANYDLKFGGHVVAGRTDVLSVIPEYRAEEIPLKEAQILLTTRFWCFIGTEPQRILREASSLNPDEHRVALQQLSKALIASGDSHLMSERIYCVKYAEKARRIAALPGIEENERHLLEWGYSYKLGKTKALLEGYDLRRLFVEALNLHLTTWECIHVRVPFYKGIFFSRLVGGVRQLIRRGSLAGIRGVLLDRIQLRFLCWVRIYLAEQRVRWPDSALLWIHCREWLSDASTYAAKVAELRLK